MARPRQSIIEYRSYDFAGILPVQIHNRMKWHISSVKSSRLHIHNCFEIGVCLSGSGKMNFGEEELPFRGGDVLFVARNVPHTTWSDPGSESVWEYIHLDPERLLGESVSEKAAVSRKFMRMLSDCRLLLPSSDYPWARNMAEAILCEAEKEAPCFESVIHGVCEALFFRLYREYIRMEEQESGVISRVHSSLYPALEYVNHHYMENFSQEFLADLCHVSPTHFRRLFRQQLGTNPLSYLHQVRMSKSRDMLRSTDLSISEIAGKTGYVSLSCFNRHFIECHGCTPSEWKNLRTDVRRTTTVGLAGWERPETDDEIETHNRQDRLGDPEDPRVPPSAFIPGKT